MFWKTGPSTECSFSEKLAGSGESNLYFYFFLHWETIYAGSVFKIKWKAKLQKWRTENHLLENRMDAYKSILLYTKLAMDKKKKLLLWAGQKGGGMILSVKVLVVFPSFFIA